MIFEVSHRTTYQYSQSVSISHHLLRLTPRACPQQVVHRHRLDVRPLPTIIKDSTDYFGNATTYLTVEEPHHELSILQSSTVEIITPQLPLPEITPPWDQISAGLARATDRALLDVYQFSFDSRFAASRSGAAEFAAPSFPPGRPILEAALDLTERIHGEFVYEGGVTDVYTPVDQVLAERRGVCQDFAHLEISCLRSIGLPARYVSGYLLTHPPAGQPRLVGADASHAWVAVWLSDYGWLDLDPTNNLIPKDEHITVAWGRDYGDVSPTSGLVVGGGSHDHEVAVDVLPVSSLEPWPAAAEPG